MQGDQMMMTNGLRPGVHCIAATPFLPDESLDLATVSVRLDGLSHRRWL
ncbi:MAG: hypothetical protein M9947_00545 [Thermomicrobiales bacterium]|nr:hypothetical protein [Thermomicrobiales bacterium]